MEARRDELVRTSGLTVSELLDDYTYIRIGDLVSLIFCNAWREELTYAGWSFRLDGWHVIVQPEAFGGRRVPMEIEARVLAEGPLTSDSELQDAFAAAPRLTISGSCGGEVGRGQVPNTSPRSPFG
jgi:hypothetical protein